MGSGRAQTGPVKLAATLQQGQAAVAAIPSILNLTSIFRALRRSSRHAQTQIGPEWAKIWATQTGRRSRRTPPHAA